MTESEENLFRNLLARFRDKEPVRFMEIVLESLLNRTESGTISGFKHKDDNDNVVAMAILFKGRELIPDAELTIAALIKKYESE